MGIAPRSAPACGRSFAVHDHKVHHICPRGTRDQLITSGAEKRARVGQADRLIRAIRRAKTVTIHNRAGTSTYPVRTISARDQNTQVTAS